ncbi:MAG: ATP-dependent DNA helicase RecG [Actinomycetes bacterium]
MAAIDPPYTFAATESPSFGEMLEASWRSPHASRLELELKLSGRAAAAAASIGLGDVGDLLEHLPHRHENRGEVKTVQQLKSGEDATVAVEVRSIEAKQSWRRRGLTITVARVADQSGPLEAVWFNQPWVARQLPVGSAVLLHGRYEGRGRFRVAEHESGVSAGGEGTTAGIVPVHPAADGLTAKRIRELVAKHRGSAVDIPEPLPARILAEHRLPNRQDAIDAIHFPATPDDYLVARRRLAFDELLIMQLDLLMRRMRREAGSPAPALQSESELTDRWIASLPFELTGDQQRAFGVVANDLARNRPMQRLLMGEVGSGKTVVAIFALLRAYECGQQAMLMAPTETLAIQHMRSIERLLDGLVVPIALLTGSTPAAERKRILARLASGELAIVVGTHALLESDLEVPHLAVCVVDEQHRFGVRQRERLAAQRGDQIQPHVLHMTATPIPRTLALAAYGDLDTSAIRELPSGRSPIATHIVSGVAARSRAYERIHEEVAGGGRAFVVCALVENSEVLDARAATEERDRLAEGPLKGLSVGLMHGRMTVGEKESVMSEFASGKLDVLVSTTVIEVGIDVPEATVMLVEDAERFGLAQLHQLRGRVGRGTKPGLCLLCGSADARRLQAMVDTNDGFKLAELDLELRGEGEITGLRQSGAATLKAARLPEDLELLEVAHDVAAELLADDPQLVDPTNAVLGLELRRRLLVSGEEQIAA